MAFALNACSDNMDESEDFNFDDFLAKWDITYYDVCPSVTDAVKYPEPWNEDIDRAFVITDETIRTISTCGLLETMLTNPSRYTHDKSELRLIPWFQEFSSYSNSLITMFNAQLGKDPMAVELFKRSDCFSVLASKYLTFIKKEKERLPENKEPNSTATLRSNYFPYFEMLLASDLCLSALNETEIIQIMAMALAYEEKAKYIDFVAETYNIMVAIMLWCNYAPFVNEVGPRLREGFFGYYLTDTEWPILSTYSTERDDLDIILKYAKEFLKR